MGTEKTKEFLKKPFGFLEIKCVKFIEKERMFLVPQTACIILLLI
ncbi:hypothetical protein [Eisenbergiella tayi]|jgi:hypothetical protein|nr:hypothetical protein [Eisenbergiella tayi]